MFFRMVYKSGQIFLPFCHGSRVWQTDRQTEISSLYRVRITCSAVKTRRAKFSCTLWPGANSSKEAVVSTLPLSRHGAGCRLHAIMTRYWQMCSRLVWLNCRLFVASSERQSSFIIIIIIIIIISGICLSVCLSFCLSFCLFTTSRK